MRAPSCPHSASPAFQRAASFAANASTLICRAPGFVGIDPGRELLRRCSPGNVSIRFDEIALGIDGEHREAVDGRLLDERDAQAGLAAAGHADADGVRDQVRRVVEHRDIGAPRRVAGVVRAARDRRARASRSPSRRPITAVAAPTDALRRRGPPIASAQARCSCRRRPAAGGSRTSGRRPRSDPRSARWRRAAPARRRSRVSARSCVVARPMAPQLDQPAQDAVGAVPPIVRVGAGEQLVEQEQHGRRGRSAGRAPARRSGAAW